MRNGVPSGTPFCLKTAYPSPRLQRAAVPRTRSAMGAAARRRCPKWARSQVRGRARSGRACTREASPKMTAAGPTGYREPRWLPGTQYRYIRKRGPICYPGAGEAMTGSRRSACDGAASHEEPRDGATYPVGGRGAGARRHLRKPRRVCESTVGVRAHGFTGPLGSLRIPARMGGVTRA